MANGLSAYKPKEEGPLNPIFGSDGQVIAGVPAGHGKIETSIAGKPNPNPFPQSTFSGMEQKPFQFESGDADGSANRNLKNLISQRNERNRNYPVPSVPDPEIERMALQRLGNVLGSQGNIMTSALLTPEQQAVNLNEAVGVVHDQNAIDHKNYGNLLAQRAAAAADLKLDMDIIDAENRINEIAGKSIPKGDYEWSLGDPNVGQDPTKNYRYWRSDDPRDPRILIDEPPQFAGETQTKTVFDGTTGTYVLVRETTYPDGRVVQEPVDDGLPATPPPIRSTVIYPQNPATGQPVTGAPGDKTFQNPYLPIPSGYTTEEPREFFPYAAGTPQNRALDVDDIKSRILGTAEIDFDPPATDTPVDSKGNKIPQYREGSIFYNNPARSIEFTETIANALATYDPALPYLNPDTGKMEYSDNPETVARWALKNKGYYVDLDVDSPTHNNWIYAPEEEFLKHTFVDRGLNLADPGLYLDLEDEKNTPVTKGGTSASDILLGDPYEFGIPY